MRLLAIDPGSEKSGLVLYDTTTRRLIDFGVPPNDMVQGLLDTWRIDKLAIEMIASYGMAVGASVFETCVWVGRFTERWLLDPASRRDVSPMPALVYRRDVKLHLCNSPRARDANIRQALIDRYGGKEKAIGRKATPGPLYGMSGDCWAALGVAVTVAETSEARVAA